MRSPDNAALTFCLGIDDDDHAGHEHHHNEPEIPEVKWGLLIQLNGETRGKNETSGIKDENSGGSIVFLSPCIRVSSGKFGGFISVGIPVIENQNGKQADIDTRIVSNLRVGR